MPRKPAKQSKRHFAASTASSTGRKGAPLGRSRYRAGIGYRGPVHPWVWDALHAAWQMPYRIESNYAREKRWAVAFAASVGWLSVVDPDGMSYGREWRVTAEGLLALQNQHKGAPE